VILNELLSSSITAENVSAASNANENPEFPTQARPGRSGKTDAQVEPLSNDNSDLLRLPAEHRVRIYQHYINDLQPEVHVNAKDQSVHHVNALLSICREIRSDVLPIFYSQTTFIIRAHEGQRWLESLQNDSAEALRKLRFVAAGAGAEMEVHIDKAPPGPGFKIVCSRVRGHRCGNGKRRAEERMRATEGHLSAHLSGMRLSEKGVPIGREDVNELLDILATWDRRVLSRKSGVPRNGQQDWLARVLQVETPQQPERST